MLALLNSLWGRLALGVAGALLVLAFCFWGLWRMAEGDRARTAAELEQVKDSLAEQVEENRRARLALDAVTRRADARAERQENQTRDEEAIRDEPVTYECAASPAVGNALRILRQRSEGNPPATDRPE
jgi:hypothetical protein